MQVPSGVSLVGTEDRDVVLSPRSGLQHQRNEVGLGLMALSHLSLRKGRLLSWVAYGFPHLYKGCEVHDCIKLMSGKQTIKEVVIGYAALKELSVSQGIHFDSAQVIQHCHIHICMVHILAICEQI